MSKTIELNFSLHPKQALAYSSHATEILYGGSAGSGKSHLIRIALVSWCLEIKGLQCYLFRLHQDEIVRTHVDSDSGFRVLLAPLVEAGLAQVLESEIRIGQSRIYLCHCNHNKDLQKYYSTEMHVLVIEEATQLMERWIRTLRTRVRMGEDMRAKIPEQLRDRFPRILYATNPVGVSQGYFRKAFIKSATPLEIKKSERKEGGFLRQYIPARLSDNPSLDAEKYSAALEGSGDEALTDALLHGNWDALVGDFLREWDEDLHVTPTFTPVATWFKFRTFDWGYSEPHCVLWWAVSDGEEFEDHMQRKRYFPRGALICYREWYGCQPDNSAKGLELSNEEIARGIVDRTPETQKSWVTITDSKPFQSHGGLSTEEIFKANGCPLVRGDTARVNGWLQLRSRLKGSDMGPMLYVVDSCLKVREYLPALQRHESKSDDAAESGEATHVCDAVRYACTARPIITKVEKPQEVYNPKTPERMTWGQAIDRARKIQQKQHGNIYY